MKVTFDISRQQIGIEGDGPELLELLTLAREIAPSLKEINIVTSGSREVPAPIRQNGAGHPGTTLMAPPANPASQTMRGFIKSLRLGSISEKITAIAYYQKTVLGKEAFAPKEMADWFVQCGIPKPSQMPVAVFDAKKKQGLVENAGHGSWTISTQGENFIIRKIEESQEPEQK